MRGTETSFLGGYLFRKAFRVQSRNVAASNRFGNSDPWELFHSVTPSKHLLELAVQINHPCRWHQHAVAIIGALIRDSVRNAISIAQNRRYKSLALPLIGAGSGRGNQLSYNLSSKTS